MTQLDLFADLDTPTEPPRPPNTPIPATFTKATPTPTPMATVRKLRPRLPGNPHGKAQQIGEAVAAVWHKQHGGTSIEVPIGIVAALTLIRIKDPEGPSLIGQILGQTDAELIEMYQQIWAGHWKQRPGLIERARILHEWLNDGPHEKHRLDLTRAVTRTALQAGILDLTGHEDPFFRSAADVLSPTMTALRSLGAQQGLGEYHTPPAVADCMGEAMVAEISVAVQADSYAKLRPGEHVHDPACGSGGMLRAAVQAVRERGIEPSSLRWSGVDIDPIAAACTAVNFIVWDLGPHSTVACADALARPNAVEEAMAEARAVFQHRDRMLSQVAMIRGIRQAHDYLNRAVAAA
ncbi:N-6 DNA methylase [Streptomyces syringium]|uniref:N-6 DNA methylase n=1 Tax=Streptomyces syringium TaxID=76729 RepID=UPI003D925B1A